MGVASLAGRSSGQLDAHLASVCNRVRNSAARSLARSHTQTHMHSIVWQSASQRASLVARLFAASRADCRALGRLETTRTHCTGKITGRRASIIPLDARLCIIRAAAASATLLPPRPNVAASMQGAELSRIRAPVLVQANLGLVCVIGYCLNECQLWRSFAKRSDSDSDSDSGFEFGGQDLVFVVLAAAELELFKRPSKMERRESRSRWRFCCRFTRATASHQQKHQFSITDCVQRQQARQLQFFQWLSLVSRFLAAAASPI